MDTPTTEPTLGRDRSLGDVLRDARQARGLELSDIAEITHVRKEYLRALEADDYSALPEDIYAKNFVKLFAQSVGLQEDRVMNLYASARGRVPAKVVSIDTVSSDSRPASPERTATRAARPPLRVGAWLPTLLFIGIIVALALWGFSNFSRPTRLVPAETAPPSTLETVEPGGATTDPITEVAPETPAESEVPAEDAPDTADVVPATDDGLFLLSITSEPAGAEVTIDGFALPGTTPLTYRLSPGTRRTLRLSLEGYEPYEEAIDLSDDLERTITLTPLNQTPVAPEAASETAGETSDTAASETAEAPTQPASSEGLNVTITDPTWLEVYASTQRGVGERLVYTTAQPGQTFTFSLPVFLHVGNAGGVELTLSGQALGAMGSSGEVISQAYTP